MNIYHIPQNITVFGNEVKTFPNGIGEAFNELIKMFPANDSRIYYGISWCIGNNVTYVAAAEQKKEDEALRYGCNAYVIEKGDYISLTVNDWQSKTACIKDYFEEIMKDPRADNKTPAIEIYKDYKEMLCLVAVKRSIESLYDYSATVESFLNTANSFDEDQVNEIPYEESWTASQVIVHVTKSNFGIAKAMKLEGEKIARNADARVNEIRTTFLDYTVKFKSPEFILPGYGPFEKDKIINDFERSIEQLKESSKAVDLLIAVKHPAFGEITKLELLHFVLFHMQRHTRQLKNILHEINSKHFSNN